MCTCGELEPDWLAKPPAQPGPPGPVYKRSVRTLVPATAGMALPAVPTLDYWQVTCAHQGQVQAQQLEVGS